ncbi:L-rhamnose isomerase [Mesoaciditoga lauensis]|uniref:L-rhamnose isomerase n=1 Tax=Mesoaciditoga lauensis TaxID=1495039 RepID=UPI00056ACCB0|nr:L-rhamnose isomerase [Mesoaciditoga lauensis]
MDRDILKQKLKTFKVEVPSWGFSDSGTRFKVFHIPGAARNIFERIDDAAQVNKYTQAVSSVAIHIPWDKVDDWKELKEYAENHGLKIGSVNPNLFQDEDYKFGSLTSLNEEVRQKAIDHVLECVDIMKKVDSKVLSLWLPDGTDYPGQGDFAKRHMLLLESLKKVYDALDEDMTLLIEYKFFEPAFYHMDTSDWGTAYALAKDLGDKAKVIIDLGHHAQGTNIEYIVSILSSRGKLGGFHFNSRKYADDDLTVGSMNLYELFLIFVELNKFFDLSSNLKPALVIDQSAAMKPKIQAMIQSVESLQISYLKSLLVDREALSESQKRNDVVSAEEIIKNAFLTDVRSTLRKMRKEIGINPSPLETFIKSGYEKKIARERG